MVHMAGLVMGLTVSPRPGATAAKPPPAKRLDLWFQQGGKRGSMPATFSYILQRSPLAPAPDSVEIPGSPLILTRDVPVDVVVHNRTTQPGGVHWHGVELLSWSDGVVGRGSNGITDAVGGVTRVVYDISGKAPATNEWEWRCR